MRPIKIAMYTTTLTEPAGPLPSSQSRVNFPIFWSTHYTGAISIRNLYCNSMYWSIQSENWLRIIERSSSKVLKQGDVIANYRVNWVIF